MTTTKELIEWCERQASEIHSVAEDGKKLFSTEKTCNKFHLNAEPFEQIRVRLIAAEKMVEALKIHSLAECEIETAPATKALSEWEVLK